MAEFIRFRLTTAKVGVSMALLALVAGVAEKAHTGPSHINATRASSNLFLKLNGLSNALKIDFLKVENKIVKLDQVAAKIEHKFLKIADANKKFLKITDANFKYLKINATAANSHKLDGLGPESFLQGNGNVVTGAVDITLTGTPAPPPVQLLSLPGGSVVVSVEGNSDQYTVTLTNGTGAALSGVQDADGNVSGNLSQISIPPNSSAALSPVATTSSNGLAQIRIQLFPNAAFPDAVSILIGLEPAGPGTGKAKAVGQAFTGGV